MRRTSETGMKAADFFSLTGPRPSSVSVFGSVHGWYLVACTSVFPFTLCCVRLLFFREGNRVNGGVNGWMDVSGGGLRLASGGGRRREDGRPELVHVASTETRNQPRHPKVRSVDAGGREGP